jgi:hypothetical protein
LFTAFGTKIISAIPKNAIANNQELWGKVLQLKSTIAATLIVLCATRKVLPDQNG